MSKKKEERKKIEKKKWKIILHGIQISKQVKKTFWSILLNVQVRSLITIPILL